MIIFYSLSASYAVLGVGEGNPAEDGGWSSI